MTEWWAVCSRTSWRRLDDGDGDGGGGAMAEIAVVVVVVDDGGHDGGP